MLSIETFSFLNEHLQEPVADGVNTGLEMVTLTLFLTLILELCSIPTVRAVLKQPGGRALYLTSVRIIIVNQYLFTIPVFVFATLVLCRKDAADDSLTFMMRFGAILLCQAVCYYLVHKGFHTSPRLYVYHRFHHRFHTNVPPVSANAVSAVEYILAYILPFAVGSLLVRPHISELRAAVKLVSICNLLVHTPRLENLLENLWPGFLVSTHGHIDHHRKLTTNYASPTINLDWIINQAQTLSLKKA